MLIIEFYSTSLEIVVEELLFIKF
ncbi:hypothetical protein CY0110_18437 [Crocosphaera chwakensis CCY0110]|uniref:Uncharacterized protein n=1 Tax=Crocosphaera chwakensis CCY0110 TaxID=391612 RepID=A3IJ19_9CHRO|nr:hypothetical protein CY0110_18437 [Crocosphaera chwakensis CCY0110]